ncbi:hypothetical protein [Paraglaciecola chathamensis]|jgi:hypothetical protein|uniref:Uncharacterized protein n=1 Tax=Paraglaciecola chathamensis TaxID=368405 RepID=A0A8H9ID59_9ALTE|nr:hypothetical protein [Paraglaciecola oceanifecundans]GGZ78424.1 hypothetical protein GCM10011274_40730 [Paraglaciecola oceanifecundans]
MKDRKRRIKCLELAADNTNPLSKENPASTQRLWDILENLKHEGLVRFTPDGQVNSSSGIEITDLGHKRLDEMKRSRYPDWLKWGAPAAAISFITFVTGLYIDTDGKTLDENQVCTSNYKPSDRKAIEAEVFIEFTATKFYAEWNMQSLISDFVANGMTKAAAEVKAESLFADLSEHPQAVKKYIEEEPRITLPELQAINTAFSSDCMKSYEKVLRKIYNHERSSR